MATWYLIVLFNASNWSGYGHRISDFPSYDACSRSLAEMKISNEQPNSGVAIVAYCAPNKDYLAQTLK